MDNLSPVIFLNQPVCILSHSIIDDLKRNALLSPLKRARVCMHLSTEASIHEMVIALHCTTYIRPHRHQRKTESFHMIDGVVLVVLFDDFGKVLQKIHLSSRGEHHFMYRLSKPMWHTVIPLTEFAIFHEVTDGPLTPSEYPAWEPKEDSISIENFKKKLSE